MSLEYEVGGRGSSGGQSDAAEREPTTGLETPTGRRIQVGSILPKLSRGGPFVSPEDQGDEYNWQDYALCTQTDPEAFFPEKGGSTREAKKVCASCEVRTDCLEYALKNEEQFGVWGGLSTKARRKLQKPQNTPNKVIS